MFGSVESPGGSNESLKSCWPRGKSGVVCFCRKSLTKVSCRVESLGGAVE